MSESAQHLALVRNILVWLNTEYLVSDLCIRIDSPETTIGNKPPMIGACKPDVFACTVPSRVTVVGEAKTSRDLETFHSREQFASYIKYLRDLQDPLLIISTSWMLHRTARNLVTQIRGMLDAPQVQLVFLHEAGVLRC